MSRRTFLSALAATSATGLSTRAADRVTATAGHLSSVVFDSSASLVDENLAELTASSVVAVWAEDTATNAAGDDNDNLNDEYVVFENRGSAAADVTDWQVEDEVDETYTFGSFTLDAGATVTLHTGSGTDTETDPTGTTAERSGTTAVTPSSSTTRTRRSSPRSRTEANRRHRTVERERSGSLPIVVERDVAHPRDAPRRASRHSGRWALLR